MKDETFQFASKEDIALLETKLDKMHKNIMDGLTALTLTTSMIIKDMRDFQSYSNDNAYSYPPDDCQCEECNIIDIEIDDPEEYEEGQWHRE